METTAEILDEIENMNIHQETINKFLTELSEKAMHIGFRVLIALVLFAIGTRLIKLIRKITKKSMQRANAEIGAIQFVDSFLKASMHIVLLLALIGYCGVDAASIIAVLGSAGVAIGLAVQGSLSNFAGGVLILMLKPFKVGDYIVESSTNKEGIVKEIQIFYTKLVTYDNQVIILPNGSLANSSLVNVTAENCRRVDIPVSVSYKADLHQTRRVLLQVLDDDDTLLKDREHIVYVNHLGNSGVELMVRCWFKQEDFWYGKWRITENCKLALDKAGIEIPFNQLDVHMDNLQK